jgi:SP family myo-inositol transporter-like MFS transporter 13
MNSTSYTYGTCSHGNRNHSDFNHTVYNETANTSVTLCDVETVADFNGTFKWFFNTCPDEDKVYSWLTVISLFVYIMFFAPGMGALPWTINSEIYPNWARSTCISMATGINWSFNLLVSLTFLTLSDHLGQPITFGMYAGLAAITVLFVFLLLPETKGRSLEDMEHLFKVPHFVNMYRWVCKKIFRKSRIPVLK